jgi:3-dehydro-L-gulonate 2-dehydrogenase
MDENHPIRYPGERVVHTREENLRDGIPVHKEIWNQIKST